MRLTKNLTLTIINEVTVNTMVHELSSDLVGAKVGDRDGCVPKLGFGVRSWASVVTLSMG